MNSSSVLSILSASPKLMSKRINEDRTHITCGKQPREVCHSRTKGVKRRDVCSGIEPQSLVQTALQISHSIRVLWRGKYNHINGGSTTSVRLTKELSVSSVQNALI